MTAHTELLEKEGYKFGFFDKEEALFKANKGLTHELLDLMSDMKEEPQWMRDFRHRAFDIFLQKEDPPWATAQLKEMCENEEPTASIVAAIKEHQSRSAIPEAELVQVIWQGLMASVDWSARADQIEGLALREVTKYAPIIEPFCTGPKTEVALIKVVQVYCYEDTRVIKTFPQILKVLYNKDCVSDQAIIYWFQKGAKPQGKQHFLKASEPLVKFLQAQEEESEEEE